MMLLRIVLDTNVLVSGRAYPKGVPAKVLRAQRRGNFELVISSCILGELIRVLPRLRRPRFTPNDAAEFASLLMRSAELVEPAAVHEGALVDSTDLPVLGTLIAARADYLITGDHRLLALADRYPVLTPAQFWARYRS